jgi:hypothetical protein
MSDGIKAPAPWQTRVLEEKSELDEKVRRLIAFRKGELWVNVDPREQLLLVRQEAHMERYASVLGERIALWGL